MRRAEAAAQLHSQYPTSALLLEFASSILETSDMRLLPSQSIPPDVIALRIVELLERLGRDLPALIGPEERSDATQTPFIASHRSFFDRACVELEKTSGVRASLMGPTFLLPDEIFAERSRRKPGRSFAHELKASADRLATVRVLVRNDRDRFRAAYVPYIEEASESLLAEAMLETASMIRRGDMFPRIEIRCVNIGFANPPHLFDNVALIGSRPRPNAAVDGGWLITDKSAVATEVDKFDRVFLSYDREQSWEDLTAFLKRLC